MPASTYLSRPEILPAVATKSFRHLVLSRQEPEQTAASATAWFVSASPASAGPAADW